MERTETCVLTNMVMIYDKKRDMVLVQNRRKAWSGLCFPGGHVEPGESFVSSAKREVFEETGLQIDDVRLCGIKQFPAENGAYRYIVLFFKSESFSGELKSSDEGEVFFLHIDEIKKYPLSDSFETMLEVFLNDNLSENYWWLENGEWKGENL